MFKPGNGTGQANTVLRGWNKHHCCARGTNGDMWINERPDIYPDVGTVKIYQDRSEYYAPERFQANLRAPHIIPRPHTHSKVPSHDPVDTLIFYQSCGDSLVAPG
jgi:hypothetical protein